MRNAAVRELTALAERDERIVLLTADLGFMVLEEFAGKFPSRFVNVGVAEANMMSLAAGMAARGLRPYCYSIATFASMRGYEQLRNGAVVHQLPVRVLGIGGGFAYGTGGITHHALEDLAIMRSQPGMAVVAPTDDRQAAQSLRFTVDHPGPIYFRIGKDPLTLPFEQSEFSLGAVSHVSSGDVVIVSTGSSSAVAFEAVRLLRENEIDAGLCLVPTLSPVDPGAVTSALEGARLVVTVEDHFVNGGLGSLVAEVIAEQNLRARLVRRAVTALSDGVTGSEHFLRERHGLSAEAVASAAIEALTSTTPR